MKSTILASALSLFIALHSSGAQTIVSFVGEVTAFSDDRLNTTAFWDSSVALGGQIYVSISYPDSPTPSDTNPASDIGFYPLTSPTSTFTLGVGNYTFTPTAYSVTIWEGDGMPGGQDDAYFVGDSPTYSQNGLSGISHSVELQSSTNPAGNPNFLSFVLGPASGLGFDVKRLITISGTYDDGFGLQSASVSGTVDTIQIGVVPEPSTTALLISGIALAAALRRRKK